jgi:hypothetical protein
MLVTFSTGELAELESESEASSMLKSESLWVLREWRTTLDCVFLFDFLSATSFCEVYNNEMSAMSEGEYV